MHPSNPLLDKYPKQTLAKLLIFHNRHHVNVTSSNTQPTATQCFTDVDRNYAFPCSSIVVIFVSRCARVNHPCPFFLLYVLRSIWCVCGEQVCPVTNSSTSLSKKWRRVTPHGDPVPWNCAETVRRALVLHSMPVCLYGVNTTCTTHRPSPSTHSTNSCQNHKS